MLTICTHFINQQAHFTQTKDLVRVFLIKLLALNSSGGAKYEGEAVLTKFYNQMSDYSVLITDFASYYNYINGFQNHSTALKSCSWFRQDMLIFSNTVCFETVSKFADQTIWIAMMGPSMCLMSICMFAAIRCPLHKDKEDNKTAPQSNYQSPGQHNTQFQNVDKNDGNMYTPQYQQQTGVVNQPGHGLDI